MLDVAVVGAGPYGLSLAAHLKALGVEFRIFGTPMQTWRSHMPKGMRLKSEGFASSLFDPNSALTLANYCKEQGLPYADIGRPVPLEVFCSYGLEFQRRFVPELEDRNVSGLERVQGGFRIHLSDGEMFTAKRVVSAVGLSYFHHMPSELASLPKEAVTHSSRHHTLEAFKGREVIVVGAGASALDLAALLHQAGASTHLVARAPVVRFHDPPDCGPRSLMTRVRFPMTGLGPGWKSYLCVQAPLLFRKLPESYRLEFVQKHLGPAPGWFVRDEVVGKVELNLGVKITRTSIKAGRVLVDVANGDGVSRTMAADHLIAATGYRSDLRKLDFLSPEIQAEVRCAKNTPMLSSNFESSVPGLHFVGAIAANAFGPLLRFAYGAGFTAKRLSRYLASSIPYAG